MKPNKIISDNVELATEILSQMTLETKIGQMFMLGFWGKQQNDPFIIKTGAYIEQGLLGGIIHYGYNISAGVRDLNQYFLNCTFLGVNPLIALDQEGGLVQRLKNVDGFTRFLSHKDVASTYTPEDAFGYYQRMAKELKQAGFNANFGPVIDVDTEPPVDVIGAKGRSFSKDVNQVIAYSTAFINAHNAVNILTFPKHFPGIGSAFFDPHEGTSDITNTFRQEELIPYEKLNEGKLLKGVMTAHVFNQNWDNVFPTTLSKKIIDQILRQQIGFQGICITDAMDMGAINKNYTLEQSIILAINAGHDIILFSNNPKARGVDGYHDAGFVAYDPERLIEIVLDGIKKGEVDEGQINRSVLKILQAKLTES